LVTNASFSVGLPLPGGGVLEGAHASVAATAARTPSAPILSNLFLIATNLEDVDGEGKTRKGKKGTRCAAV
jgi:hypothetical protein